MGEGGPGGGGCGGKEAALLFFFSRSQPKAVANGGLRRRMAAIVLPLTGGKKIWGSGRHTYTHTHTDTQKETSSRSPCAQCGRLRFFFFFFRILRTNNGASLGALVGDVMTVNAVAPFTIWLPPSSLPFSGYRVETTGLCVFLVFFFLFFYDTRRINLIKCDRKQRGEKKGQTQSLG